MAQVQESGTNKNLVGGFNPSEKYYPLLPFIVGAVRQLRDPTTHLSEKY